MHQLRTFQHILAAILYLVSLASAQAAGSGFPALSTVTDKGSKASAAASFDGITGAPTVTNSNAVPTYPPPTVPPTADAPFMQKSSLPSGTVFICAGAVLGFMLACVILWRGWVAWSLHRSMRRVNRGYMSLAPQAPGGVPMGGGFLDGGATRLKKKMHFYKQPAAPGSLISMGLLQPHADDVRAASSSPPPSLGLPPDKRSLFFSPTAASGLPSSGLGTKSTTEYMPSGYYPGVAASAMPGSSRLPTLGSAPNGRQSSAPADLLVKDSVSPTPLIQLDSSRDPSSGLAAHLLAAQQNTISARSGPGSRAPSMYLDDMFQAGSTPQQHER